LTDAARCARAAKEFELTWPPLTFAVLDWIRAAALEVMGDEDLEALDDMLIPFEVVARIGNVGKTIDSCFFTRPRQRSKIFRKLPTSGVYRLLADRGARSQL
jgi:hypothetical protein